MRAELASRAWARVSLRSVIDHLPDMVFHCDADGTVRYANEAFLAFHSSEESEVVGRSFIALSPPEERPRLRGVLAEIQSLTPEHDSRRGEFGTRDADGAPIWHVWTDQAFFDHEGTMLGFTSVGRDITDRKLREGRAKFRLIHDSLTGLRNRRGALSHLSRLLNVHAQADVAVLYLDLTSFKAINDTMGHAAGDAALIGCAEGLREASGDRDLVCRIGGDEFLIIVGGPGAELAARATARRARRVLADLPQPLAAGIGIAVARPGETADDLLARADEAMYRDKRSGAR